MTFLEHLDELRKRLVVSVAAIVVGCLIAFAFVDKIYSFVMDPLYRLLPKGSTLIFTEPTEAFILYVKMALLAGIVMAMPVILWQVVAVHRAGALREGEEARDAVRRPRDAWGSSAAPRSPTTCSSRGCGSFFASFATDKLTFLPRIEPVFALYVKMILGMGLVFQMPAVVYSLARIGLVTARFLHQELQVRHPDHLHRAPPSSRRAATCSRRRCSRCR